MARAVREQARCRDSVAARCTPAASPAAHCEHYSTPAALWPSRTVAVEQSLALTLHLLAAPTRSAMATPWDPQAVALAAAAQEAAAALRASVVASSVASEPSASSSSRHRSHSGGAETHAADESTSPSRRRESAGCNGDAGSRPEQEIEITIASKPCGFSYNGYTSSSRFGYCAVVVDKVRDDSSASAVRYRRPSAAHSSCVCQRCAGVRWRGGVGPEVRD